jgi:hypothetical protein
VICADASSAQNIVGNGFNTGAYSLEFLVQAFVWNFIKTIPDQELDMPRWGRRPNATIQPELKMVVDALLDWGFASLSLTTRARCYAPQQPTAPLKSARREGSQTKSSKLASS